MKLWKAETGRKSWKAIPVRILNSSTHVTAADFRAGNALVNLLTYDAKISRFRNTGFY